MQLKTNLLTDQFDAPVLKTFLVKDNVIQKMCQIGPSRHDARILQGRHANSLSLA